MVMAQQLGANAGRVSVSVNHMLTFHSFPCSNTLLIFIPIGWALYFAKHSGGVSSISDTAVFCTTFIAIIPLGMCCPLFA